MLRLGPVAAGTVVAKSCLPFARVLAASFAGRHPRIPFFVLLADEVGGFFDPAAEPFELLYLDDLDVPRGERFRFQHGQQELSYAAAPYLLRHLLDRGFERALFLKQESLVVGDLSPAIERLERHSIVLTPHLLEPLSGADGAVRELEILLAGTFNVGLLGVSESAEARRFLTWWQDRVFRRCRHVVGEGMHYEQRWIDLVPAYFDGACILRDPGANVGHWCLPERLVEVRDGEVWAAGGSCSLFRFSGFDPELPQAVTRYTDRLRVAELGSAAELFERFAALLAAAGYHQARAWPYAFGRFDNDVPIPEVARRIYADLGEAVEAFGDPFSATGAGSFFRWLGEPVDGSGRRSRRVTRLWHAVWGERLDVRRAFPDPLGRDCAAFLDWTVRSGAAEHGIPDAFRIGRQP